MASRETKECPFCGEDILAVAIKCKHCREFLPSVTPTPADLPDSADGGSFCCDECTLTSLSVENFRAHRHVSGHRAWHLGEALPSAPALGDEAAALQYTRDMELRYGKMVPWTPEGQMVCPHCGVEGMVTTRTVRVKKGISGGKAVGALVTGGLSILATGLSRKETLTAAACANCRATWHF